MVAWFRAGLAAALFVFVSTSAPAADKTFQDDALDEAAITLEANLANDAGTVELPVIKLKEQAAVQLRAQDLAAAAQTYVQIVAVAPEDSAAWRRLADIWLAIPTSETDDGSVRYDNARTAAYIAYQRATTPQEDAAALTTLASAFGKHDEWRQALNALHLALKLDPNPGLQANYDLLREKYGFRVSNFTVDSDAASPRACFQFSEPLLKRADFSPYVAVVGEDKPALSVDDQQLCVEGLKHGETYAITLRQGLPSSVDESLLKDAEFNIYVRDRSPSVRLSGKAYVLPKTGQQGIPLISVNTALLKVTIYRIGDRNLIDKVLGYEFERNLYRYDLEDIADQTGQQAWTGELEVEKQLNAEITTAFPIGEAVPDMEPGVYILAAAPADVPGDSYSERTTQWFIVSDYGLTAFSGSDGIHAFVNSLATTAPIEGVKVRLIARNNEVLATATTDANGKANFAPGLARGEGGLAPALLVASSKTGGDYAFLNLVQSAFDLTDRGVAGRDPPKGLDAFVFTERGVYRTGETVHVTSLLRNAEGVAVPDVNLTVVIERPDGIEYRRTVVPDEGIGGRSLDVPLIASAPTGTWRVAVYSDPKQSAIGTTSFLVEDYVPDRLEFDITTDATELSPSQPAEIALDGHFLYGAPAAGLVIDGNLRITEAKERPGFPGYAFGINDPDSEDRFSAESYPLVDLPDTDEAGKATFEVALDEAPVATKPLSAAIVVRLAEPGGRAIERTLDLPIVPSQTMIGVKPLFKGASLGDQDTAKFDVVMAAPDGKEVEAKGLKWQLLSIESKYQWYRQYGYWSYEPIKITRRVADGTIDVAPGQPGQISVPVTWGRYRLEIESADPQGPLTTYGFDSGWYADASADTPDLLEIALDKPEYTTGDTMTVAITARSAGTVTLSVIGDRLITQTTAEVEPGLVKLPITVGDDWGTGAYVLATLRRPLDEAEKRMPGRAIGVQWFSIDKAENTIGVALDLPDLIRPETKLRVPVKLAGLAGEEARIVVSAVDVGILNLTGYEPPAPDEYYLGQRKLSAEIRDLYGDLIDGMQGTKGQIRTGGDGGMGELQGSPPTQPPLALYSGIVTVGPDGTAEVEFAIPAFTGTVRVMAVAWSKDKVGHGSGDVVVRDPVVVTATLPRFLLSGDKSTLRLDLDNVEGATGTYAIAVSTAGPLSVENPDKSIELDAKKRGAVMLPISAAGVGTGTVDVAVTGPEGFSVARRYALTVNPATQILARRTVKPLEPGQSITLTNDVFADLVPGTGSVALSVTPSAALDVASLLAALDRYPLGCTEQIVSRALPLLYVNEMALDAKLAVDTNIDERVTKAIEIVLARQGYEGAFGLWSPGGDDAWLDGYVTDFLTRARARGFAVPDDRFKLALSRLRNYVSTAPDVATDGGLALSYALYVLARNGQAPVGDLRYIADVKLDKLGTPTAQAEIGAALAMLGDKVRAEKAFSAAAGGLPLEPKFAGGRPDYGSVLRDAAVVVTLAAEGDAPKVILVSATQQIDKARDLVTYTSTQEDAWLVLAARALGKQGVSLSIEEGAGGEGGQEGPLYRTFDEEEIGINPLTVTNRGDTPLDAVISVSGAPTSPEPAADHGFKLERTFHTLDGEEVDIAAAKQNQRFVVLLTVTEAQPQFARVALTDYVPAGFEIDNPRLVSSADTGGLDWIEGAADPVHTEFRDNRFVAAFERRSDSPVVYTVAYIVRAVSPGSYVLPQAVVEDMYRPDRFGRTGTGAVTVTSAR
ncbi:MAG: alpha-2-macroglobulin family protein [Methyloceanibacter sp.]|uniref:alpha-2-macroglobulin family protein n=1 Tax=Methyloceanibacter sp. TaxID=1965321 RepID=UPI003D6CC7B7